MSARSLVAISVCLAPLSVVAETSIAGAERVLPLEIGTYVDADVACDLASNADWLIFTGSTFSFSKTSTEMEVVEADGRSYRVVISMVDLQSGDYEESSAQTWDVEVISPSEVTIDERTFRHCPD